jgi:hypothetical protein
LLPYGLVAVQLASFISVAVQLASITTEATQSKSMTGLTVMVIEPAATEYMLTIIVLDIITVIDIKVAVMECIAGQKLEPTLVSIIVAIMVMSTTDIIA